MSNRQLVFGLLKDLVNLGDETSVQELVQLLARTQNEVPGKTVSESMAMTAAARLVLETATDRRSQFIAVGAVIRAAHLTPTSLSVLEAKLDQPNVLFAIAGELPALSRIAPDFAARAGAATFRLAELGQGTEATDSVDSLSFRHHYYVEVLPALLRQAPTAAVPLAFAILFEARRETVARYQLSIPLAVSFELLGGTASMADDGLTQLVSSEDGARAAAQALAAAALESTEVALLCRTELTSSFWSALLNCCASDAGRGVKFVELLSAVPILSGEDTRAAALDFLAAATSHLREAEFERIARAVTALPDDGLAREFAFLLPSQFLTGRLSTLTHDGLPRIDLRRRNVMSFEIGAPERGYWIRYMGGDPTETQTALLLELLTPLEIFESAYANRRAPRDEARAIVGVVTSLSQSLPSAGGHESARSQAIDAMAAVARIVLRSDELSVEHSIELRDVVVAAARHPLPERVRSEFTGGWGRPSPRIQGAAALMEFGMRHGVDQEVGKLIDDLALDEVGAVRYQVFVRANALYDTDSARMWRLLEQWVLTDQDSLLFLHAPLSAIFRGQPARTAALCASLWARRDLKKAEETRAQVAPLVGYLALVSCEPLAVSILDQIFEELSDHSTEVELILAEMRMSQLWLQADARLRRTGLGFLERVLVSARLLKSTDEKIANKLVAEIVTQIGFSLQGANGELRATPEVALRFFADSDSLLQGISDFGVSGFAVHAMTTLLRIWMAHRPERATLALASLLDRASAIEGWWNIDKLVECLLLVDSLAVRKADARSAFLRAASKLLPFAGAHEPALRAQVREVARGNTLA
jgi:hypothetical protein